MSSRATVGVQVLLLVHIGLRVVEKRSTSAPQWLPPGPRRSKGRPSVRQSGTGTVPVERLYIYSAIIRQPVTFVLHFWCATIFTTNFVICICTVTILNVTCLLYGFITDRLHSCSRARHFNLSNLNTNVTHMYTCLQVVIMSW